MIDTEDPANQWNVYGWHFSDGDDFDPERTVAQIQKLLARDINMLGYGEIEPDHSQISFMGMSVQKGETTLKKAMTEMPGVQKTSEGGLPMLIGTNTPFLAVTIHNRGDLLPALKQFLKKDRWANA